MFPNEFPTGNVEYSCLKPDANHVETIDRRYIELLNICKTKRLTVQLVNLDLNEAKGNSHSHGRIAHKSGVVKEMRTSRRKIKTQKRFCSRNRKFCANRNGGLKKKNINSLASYSCNNVSKMLLNNNRFTHRTTKNKRQFQTFEATTRSGELRIILERLSDKEMKKYSRSYKKIIVPKVILHRLTVNEIRKYNIHTPKYRGKQIMTIDRKTRHLTLHTENCGIEERKIMFQRRLKKTNGETITFLRLKSFNCKSVELMKHSCRDFQTQKKGSATPQERLRKWEIINYGWTNQSIIEKKRKSIVPCEDCKKKEIQNDVDKSKVLRRLAQLMKALALRGTDKPIIRSLCVCGQLFL